VTEIKDAAVYCFTIIMKPEWSLHLRTKLYQHLSNHENVRFIDGYHAIRVFKDGDKKTYNSSNRNNEITPPFALVYDLGSFFVVSKRRIRTTMC
jgi:hypothetical protein